MSDGNTPTEHPGKSSRGRLGALIAVILLPILAYGTIKYLQRPDHKPPFYARVSVDMEVNGQPVHLERIITCKTMVAGNGGDITVQIEHMFKRKRTEWVAWPRAFGEVLPDGSAIMVRTPYRCYREYYTDDSGNIRIRASSYAENYLPLIGWSTDGVEVETLELYLSDTYYKQPDARVRNPRVTTELVDDTVKPSDLDPFAWFSGLSHQPMQESQRVAFTAFSGWILKEPEWRGLNSDLDKLLDSYDQPAALPQNEITHQIPSYVDKILDAEHRNINLLIPQDSWRGISSTVLGTGHPLPSALRNNMFTRSMHDFPTKDGAIWLTGPVAKGYVRMRRAYRNPPSNNPKTAMGVPLQDQPVILAGTRFDPGKTRYFYNPATKELYWVKPQYLSARVDQTHPFFMRR